MNGSPNELAQLAVCLETLEKDIKNGKIGARIDLGRCPGLESIAGTINRMLDSYQQPLDEVIRLMGFMSFNDFSKGMSTQYEGDFKTLAESTNLVRTRLLSAEDLQ